MENLWIYLVALGVMLLQGLISWRVKKLYRRLLLPVILLLFGGIQLLFAVLIGGWEALAFLVFAIITWIFSGAAFLVLIAFEIARLVKRLRAKKQALSQQCERLTEELPAEEKEK